MRISDWSSDVCSSDLQPGPDQRLFRLRQGNDEVGVAYDMFGRFRHRERRPPRGLMPIDKLPRLFGTTRQDADVIDLKSLEQGRDDLVGDTARPKQADPDRPVRQKPPARDAPDSTATRRGRKRR